jgi:hypothetical protein
MWGIDLKKASEDDLSNPANIEFIKIKTAIPSVTPKAATIVKFFITDNISVCHFAVNGILHFT